MTADGWTQVVREQLGLGALLPLGGPGDGVWIAESAARAGVRREVGALPGARLGALGFSAVEDRAVAGAEAGVPAPPTALPPGPLRITGELAAALDAPLPVTVARARAALAGAARVVGLGVVEVDLRVTEVLDADAGPGGAPGPSEGAARAAGAASTAPDRAGRPDASDTSDAPGDPGGAGGDVARVAAVAARVPGVARLTGALGGLAAPVRITEPSAAEPGGAPALPRRHVRVELAVAADTGPLEVGRAVRRAVTDAFPDHPSVAVLVTAWD
ncbi:nucleopolyhedrovirus P10 family protein [Streptomyces sp. NPDC127068]|uniref:nucleopolyhedrovirus P10 family protein n=1 Tax=Streptomyces sp. NPDC127068 TaxID=3347127 RepID=UPI003658FAE5